MTRMIVLAGAPEPAKLDWSEKSLYPTAYNGISNTTNKTPPSPSAKTYSAQWRQLATDRLQMRPLLPRLDINSQLPESTESQTTEFFTPNDFIAADSAGSDASGDESHPSGSSVVSAPEALSDFYDHSFTIHEAIPSSELSSIVEPTPDTPTYESTQEMFIDPNNAPTGIIRTPSPRRLSQAPRPKNLNNLNTIPNAKHLRSIAPQTMTVNLIVAILSISATRKVTTGRQYGHPRQAELVELTVGDDTKSGFIVTMWLPREMHVNWKDRAHAQPEGSRSILRRNLKSLRRGDVVLLQNVALSSYQGKVHGQSLKGDVTKIDLLFRKKIDDDDVCGFYTVSNLRNPTGKDGQLVKVKKVRDWVVEYVGEGDVQGGRRKRKGAQRTFPNDTQ